MRVGMAELRLCEGYVPQYKEMVELSRPLIKLLIEDLGTKETLRRFSDPFWFQSFACALGFEHNYTGATTVTIKALKEALGKDEDIIIIGGKGENAINTPKEIELLEKENIISSKFADNLQKISRVTAKADNNLLQDSYDLYFHAIITDGKKNYVVINQGMNTLEKLVRRYHWYNPESYEDKNIRDFTFIKSLDLQVKSEIQNTMLDLVKDEKPQKIVKKALVLSKHYELYKKGIRGLFLSSEEKELFERIRDVPYHLYFPKKLNEDALRIAHESANTFKELSLTPNMGKSTLRGLAYLSALIYGKEITWENPQKFCYAFGTKAGKPWYIQRKAMRKASTYLKQLIESSEIEKKKRKEVLKRLSKLL